jgi:hypothetical protein
MKKYPVYYKGKRYEVRWHCERIVKTISVYEVLPRKFFKYKDLGTFYLYAIHELHDLDLNDENLHIKEAKHAVQMAIKKIEEERRLKVLKETRKQKLQEWDGFIE